MHGASCLCIPVILDKMQCKRNIIIMKLSYICTGVKHQVVRQCLGNQLILLSWMVWLVMNDPFVGWIFTHFTNVPNFIMCVFCETPFALSRQNFFPGLVGIIGTAGCFFILFGSLETGSFKGIFSFCHWWMWVFQSMLGFFFGGGGGGLL
jgi:hypothetical protein